METKLDSPEHAWNLVWQVDPENIEVCIERDWFRFLFSNVSFCSTVVNPGDQPLLSATSPPSIVCVSSPNRVNPTELANWLQRLPGPTVLYHMSDEFLDVGAEVYRHCDLAIRNGSARFELTGNPSFLQLPLGYARGLANESGSAPPASTRSFSFSFLGTLKHEREDEMLPALKVLPGSYHFHETQTWQEAVGRFDESTTSVYKRSVFVPCPRGNRNPECNRLYDALEWGCIPLIRNYKDTDYTNGYFKRLLGAHPLPTFDNWPDAARFAGKLLGRPAELDYMQRTVCDWWRQYKQDLRAELTHRIKTVSDSANASRAAP